MGFPLGEWCYIFYCSMIDAQCCIIYKKELCININDSIRCLEFHASWVQKNHLQHFKENESINGTLSEKIDMLIH
jgi:hypothetical protein